MASVIAARDRNDVEWMSENTGAQWGNASMWFLRQVVGRYEVAGHVSGSHSAAVTVTNAHYMQGV